jgi:glycosyltransferase involved in cell wall biosynthesis
VSATDRITVSVVTPSFNQGGFIREAVDSVLAQDGVRLEYLVVDGGSTDGTLEVLRAYGDRVRWMSEPDRGQADAINKGWRRTTGEIIAWLNADDVYRPGGVRRAVAFLSRHPDVDLVFGDCDYIDGRGAVIGRHRTRPVDSLALLRSAISYIPQPAAFLRRRVLDTVGYLDETLHYVMDFDFWLRVAVRHRIAYLPECLAAFRFHGGSKSVRQSAQMADELIRVYDRLFASPNLPAAVRRLERVAMSNARYLAADYYLLAGQSHRARACVLDGWRRLPWNLQPRLFKVLALGQAGSRGARIAAWLRYRSAGHSGSP